MRRILVLSLCLLTAAAFGIGEVRATSASHEPEDEIVIHEEDLEEVPPAPAGAVLPGDAAEGDAFEIHTRDAGHKQRHRRHRAQFDSIRLPEHPDGMPLTEVEFFEGPVALACGPLVPDEKFGHRHQLPDDHVAAIPAPPPPGFADPAELGPVADEHMPIGAGEEGEGVGIGVSPPVSEASIDDADALRAALTVLLVILDSIEP